MQSCAICGVCITASNNTREHIIQNALGGRLKVRGVLCKECNSNAGKSWDAELALQLNPLSLLLGIAREHGKTPSQNFATIAGGIRLLHANGSSTPPHPTFREEITDVGITIRATARTFEEA